MEQLIPSLQQYLPYIISGAFSLGGLAGIGGTVKYVKRKNSNNKLIFNCAGNEQRNDSNERRNFVRQHECDLTHQGLNNQLLEGNRRMESMEKTLININDNLHQLGQNIGQLQGSHKMLAETVMLKL